MPEGEGGPSICLYSLGDLGPGHLLIHFQKWKCNNEKCQKGWKTFLYFHLKCQNQKVQMQIIRPFGCL